MILKDGFVLREISGQYMAIPVGKRVNDLHGMIVLNETGAFIWRLLKTEQNEASILDAILEEYDVNYDDALTAIKNFISTAQDYSLLEGNN